jgi:hypothetical protein
MDPNNTRRMKRNKGLYLMSNRWDFGRINPHFQYGTLHFDNDGIISNYFHFKRKVLERV